MHPRKVDALLPNIIAESHCFPTPHEPQPQPAAETASRNQSAACRARPQKTRSLTHDHKHPATCKSRPQNNLRPLTGSPARLPKNSDGRVSRTRPSEARLCLGSGGLSTTGNLFFDEREIPFQSGGVRSTTPHPSLESKSTRRCRHSEAICLSRLSGKFAATSTIDVRYQRTSSFGALKCSQIFCPDC